MKINKVLRMLSISCFIFFVIYVGVFIYNYTKNDTNPTDYIYGIDYADYYAAGRMVDEGDIANIYNVQIHQDRLETLLGRSLPFELAWPYPPTFLLVVVPLSFLPYTVSLALWLLLTFSLAAVAIYRLVPQCRKLTFLFFGFAGVYWNIKWGQNGFLSAALLGFGLAYIESNPIISGLAFGLLTYKPQLAIIPLILLLILKKWRVLLWSCISAASLIVLSSLVFGIDVWVSFFHSFFGNTVGNYLQWDQYAAINPSSFSLFKLMGLNNTIAYILLGILIIAVLFIVCKIWKKSDNMRLRGAAFILCLPLTTPYFLQYDLIILAIPLILLTYDYYLNGYRRIEFILTGILFIMPVINWQLVCITWIQICPIVLIMLLGMIYYRCKRCAIGQVVVV